MVREEAGWEEKDLGRAVMEGEFWVFWGLMHECVALCLVSQNNK